MIYKILTVIGLATFEIYAAIPAGFAFKISPIEIFLYSVLGGLIGVFVAAYLGDIIKKWLHKFRTVKDQKVAKEPGFRFKNLGEVRRNWLRPIGYHDRWSTNKYWHWRLVLTYLLIKWYFGAA